MDDPADLARRDAMILTASEMKLNEIIILLKTIHDCENQIAAAKSVNNDDLKADLLRRRLEFDGKIQETSKELKRLKEETADLSRQIQKLELSASKKEQEIGSLEEVYDSALDKLNKAIDEIRAHEVVDLATQKAMEALGQLYEAQQWEGGKVRIRAWVSDSVKAKIKSSAAIFGVNIVD